MGMWTADIWLFTDVAARWRSWVLRVADLAPACARDSDWRMTTFENHSRLGSPARLDWMVVDLHTGEPLKVEGTGDPLEFGSYREASFWLSEKYGKGICNYAVKNSRRLTRDNTRSPKVRRRRRVTAPG